MKKAAHQRFRLTFYLLPASFEKALILECVGQGIQTVRCLVPGALGVREGGYIIVGGLLGIQGDAAFALALIRRVRELALGLPGLFAWTLRLATRRRATLRTSIWASDGSLETRSLG
jgi:uncharacterized membrane protein YbhN (UPF0104 family)